MPELAAVLAKARNVKADPSRLSKFLIAPDLGFRKTRRASGQDRPELAKARAEWKDRRPPIMGRERHRLIFAGETGATAKITRLRGRLNSKAPFGHWGTQAFAAGLERGGLNPIEMAVSKLKAHLRATAARNIGDPWKAIGNIGALLL